ncbi:MAG: glutamate--tRNA ligase family protein [Bacteroidia bacterium]
MKTRIAPTPSGYLHIGNGFNFVLTWLHGRSTQSEVMLRVDDLDKARIKPEYVEDIFRTLDWLGIDWDSGPFGPDDVDSKWSQHHRLDRYKTALDELSFKDYAYACALSRAQIADAGGYPESGFMQKLPLSQANTSLRARTEDRPVDFTDANGTSHSINLHDMMRAFVLRRRDGLPAYQVASLVDDLDFGIDLIVRGKDLLASTAAQLWLSEKLERDAFAKTTFVHHDLLADEAGAKLSKSEGADALAAWRANKTPVSEFYRRIAVWLGLPEVGTAAELLDLKRSSNNDSIRR